MKVESTEVEVQDRNWLSEAEMALELGIEVRTLRNYLCNRPQMVPPSYGRGKNRRFLKSEYYRWQVAQSQKASNRAS